MIFLAGTSDTKAEEMTYLRDILCKGPTPVCCVDVGTRAPAIDAEVTQREVADHHPNGGSAVLGLVDRGQAVAGMTRAFAAYCRAHKAKIDAIIGVGGGGGTAIITAGMRTLPYGVPKVMVSTLASGDVAPYVDTSDIIMMPSVTDIAGLNRVSRHILHNAAQSVCGMASHPFVATADSNPSIGLSMFGVTTPSVTQISERLRPHFDCVVFHATGTGGRSMEQMLDQGMLHGLIDITTTEIADEVVGGVLSAGVARLDAVIRTGKPYVGSVGALDMVNFWAPDTVPQKFQDRLFYHHNDNVTLMRTTPDECARTGAWIADKLNMANGPVQVLLPEGGISALDAPDGPFFDPDANAALFETLEARLIKTDLRGVQRVPHHINDPAFSAYAAKTFLDIV